MAEEINIDTKPTGIQPQLIILFKQAMKNIW